VIRLEQVTKTYDAAPAVDGLSLSLAPHSIVVLLGSSGCGKTTTLRLIAGLERPDSGTIHIDGRVVAGGGAWVPPEKRRIGMVFQDYALFPHLTASANIAFALSGADGAARRARVGELLAQVGLTEKGERYPHQLSGGEQQRVALARALAAAPALVLLDEPFSNLDASLRKAMREEVLAILRAAGAAAVFVTHDQEEAMRLADHVVIMGGGRVLQTGTPDGVYRAPVSRVVADFLGEAAYLNGDALGDQAVCALGTVRLAAPAHGRVLLMLRPEMIALEADAAGSAVITDARYHGPYRALTLAHSSGLRLEAKVWAQHAFSIGDRVRVAVGGAAVAFAPDAADT
jgi:iron(III) transport system ATP-binding protein